MKSNAELKKMAWERLWADRWFGRLFGVGLVLSLSGRAVSSVLHGILAELGVQDWQDYATAVLMNYRDLTTPVPNLTPEFMSRATSSTCLEMFFACIMAGIASYGCAVVLLKCLRNDGKGWFGAAFGGFRFPFGMLWMYVRLTLTYLVWFVLFPPLALMPFYRYRFLFLVKADHPDWSGNACFRACAKLMKGNKMKSFRLDCAYWRPITGLLLLLLAVTVCAAAGAFLSSALQLVAGGFVLLGLLAAVVASVVLAQYVSVGQGFLYEEIAADEPGRVPDGDSARS